MINAKNIYKKFTHPVKDLEVLKNFIFKKNFKKNLKANEFFSLHDINFEIENGENVLVIGNSKSGKTTLYSILNEKINYDYGILNISKSIFSNNFCKFPHNMMPRASLNEFIEVLVAFNNNFDLKFRNFHLKNFIIKDLDLNKEDLNKNFYDFSINLHRNIILSLACYTGHKIYLFDNWGFKFDDFGQNIIQNFVSQKKNEINIFFGNADEDFVFKYIDKIIILEDGKLSSCKKINDYDKEFLLKNLKNYKSQSEDLVEIDDEA